MAQFIVIPTLARVAFFFKEATGKPLTPSVTWQSWKTLSGDIYNEILLYIRPCHRKIIEDTIDGVYTTPCAIMRQLLRPHGLRIEYRNKIWKLSQDEKGGLCVRTLSGCIVSWN